MTCKFNLLSWALSQAPNHSFKLLTDTSTWISKKLCNFCTCWKKRTLDFSSLPTCFSSNCSKVTKTKSLEAILIFFPFLTSNSSFGLFYSQSRSHMHYGRQLPRWSPMIPTSWYSYPRVVLSHTVSGWFVQPIAYGRVDDMLLQRLEYKKTMTSILFSHQHPDSEGS